MSFLSPCGSCGTYSGHTARTVGLCPAASPPLLLFLRKVLLLLSSWTKSATKSVAPYRPGTWISGTCDSSLLCALVWGKRSGGGRCPPQKQFVECLHRGHQPFSVFTLALSFLRQVIRNWPRNCPLRTSKIFSLGCTLWTNTRSVRLEKPLSALVSLTTSPLPWAPTLSRCHVHFPTGLFTLGSNSCLCKEGGLP